MSDYNINVSAVKLPTGSKLVRLGASMPSGEFVAALILEPKVARALAKALLEAALRCERVIDLPNEAWADIGIDALKGDT